MKYVIVMFTLVVSMSSCTSDQPIKEEKLYFDFSSYRWFHSEVRLEIRANEMGDTIYSFQAYGMAGCAGCYEPTWNEMDLQ